MKRTTLILIVIVISLSSCAREGFSPGPKGPIGPQGDLGPKGPLGPSAIDVSCSSESIVIEDTGELVQREYPIRGISQVEVSDFFTAEVRQGETYRVMVEAEEALTPYLDVAVRGETLYIGLKSGYTYCFENASQRVEVTLPALTLAHVREHSTTHLTGFKAGETLRLEATDHSTLHLMDFEAGDTLQLEVTDFSTLRGAIDARNVQVEVSNHSSLNLTGSTSQVMGEVTDISSADLTGLKASELDIDTDTHSTLSQ